MCDRFGAAWNAMMMAPTAAAAANSMASKRSRSRKHRREEPVFSFAKSVAKGSYSPDKGYPGDGTRFIASATYVVSPGSQAPRSSGSDGTESRISANTAHNSTEK